MAQQYEAVPESLKNVVLVMNASNILVPPSSPEDTRTPSQASLWQSTHEKMDSFLPGFLDELIPSPLPPRAPAAVEPSIDAPAA